MHYDGRDTGSCVQEMGVPTGVPKVCPRFDHRKSAADTNPTHQSHHLRAGAQASTKKSREGL